MVPASGSGDVLVLYGLQVGFLQYSCTQVRDFSSIKQGAEMQIDQLPFFAHKACPKAVIQSVIIIAMYL